MFEIVSMLLFSWTCFVIVQTTDALCESSPVSFLLISFSRSLIRQEKMWNVCIKIVIVEVNDTKTPLRQVSPVAILAHICLNGTKIFKVACQYLPITKKRLIDSFI